MILKEGILQKLNGAGFVCTVENPIPHGIQLRLGNGAVVNIYESGKLLVQGKCTSEVKQILGVH
jgi:predicted nucleotide-binding protein